MLLFLVDLVLTVLGVTHAVVSSAPRNDWDRFGY
jgi:hypothetical protein